MWQRDSIQTLDRLRFIQAAHAKTIVMKTESTIANAVRLGGGSPWFFGVSYCGRYTLQAK